MTREQARALLAFEHVGTVPEGERKMYGSTAHNLPALVRSAGLCQALHFVKSRDKGPQNLLLDHLAQQAGRVLPGIDGRDRLCEQARSAELGRYLLLTREILAAATWYSRLAESELHVRRGEDAVGD